MLSARLEQGSTLALSLRAPEGTIIDAQRADTEPDIVAKIEENAAVFMLLDAQPGQWQMVLEAVAAPSGGAKFISWLSYQSSVEMAVQLNRGLYQPGETGRLTVNLTGAPSKATVTATIGKTSAGQTITLAGTNQRLDRMMLWFYGRYLPPDKELRYVPQGVWPKEPPIWLIASQLEGAPAPAGSMILSGERYGLVAHYVGPPLSGIHWAVYRHQPVVTPAEKDAAGPPE